jgi:hypothetical protein
VYSFHELLRSWARRFAIEEFPRGFTLLPRPNSPSRGTGMPSFECSMPFFLKPRHASCRGASQNPHELSDAPSWLERGLCGLPVSFLRPTERFGGMFHRLPGMLLPGLVIFLAVMRGSGAMRVCGEFVEFGSSLVRLTWHSSPHPPCCSNLKPFRIPSCSIMDTRLDLARFRSFHQLGRTRRTGEIAVPDGKACRGSSRHARMHAVPLVLQRATGHSTEEKTL